MLFSIVSICKNDRIRLINTLNSISSQTYTGFEIIIQDGCSTDGTYDVVSQFNNINIRYYSENDDGIYDAMNRAIDRCSGEYIIFLNAGDYFASDEVLEKVSKEISNNLNGDIYYGNAVVISPDGTENYQEISFEPERLISDEVLESGSLCLIHQAIFTKREVLEKIRFDCKYKLRAELDWYYKVIKSNTKLVRMPFPVCLYALGGMSESIKAADINISERVKILESYGYSSDNYISMLSKSHIKKGIYKYIYSQWMILKNAGRSLSSYLLYKGIRSVAIFGYGELGCHIFSDLKDSDINVEFFIESNERYPYAGIPVFKPNDCFECKCIDIIIVSAIIRFEEIRSEYQEIFSKPLVSFEHILEDMWKYNYIN